VVRRRLGKTGFEIAPIGFGAFKIGRNQKIKYPSGYDLPDDAQTEQLLNGVLDLGINFIDTAPAYGISEQRIGQYLSTRRDDFVLSTKVGETFEDGQSTYGFSAQGVRKSIARSHDRLSTDVLDIVLIHSDGNDLDILNNTDTVATLIELKQSGQIRAIGFSGKTTEGARAAMAWADVLMVEYHIEDTSHESVIADAADQGIGVLVKKGLAAGKLDAAAAIRFALSNPGITSMVIGSLSLEHLGANCTVAPSPMDSIAWHDERVRRLKEKDPRT
jgi:aryl-alcohol dehydrogenase-like predicted oxidoreductase